MTMIVLFCTYAWAAERLGVSLSQVARYVHDEKLKAVTPLVGSRESARHKRMLYREDVERLADARLVVARVVGDCSCKPHPIFGHEDGCRYVGSGASRG